MKHILTSVFIITIASVSFASKRPDHFEAKESKNLEQAFDNLSEYNSQIEKLIKGELSDKDMVEIHKSSYTLEKAIERIDQEVSLLAETLEEIHIASEQMDKKAVKEKSPDYLKRSQAILRKK